MVDNDFQSGRYKAVCGILICICLFIFFFTGCASMPTLTTPEGDKLKGEGTLHRQTIDIPKDSTITINLSEPTQLNSVQATLVDAEAAHRANRIFLYGAGAALIVAAIVAKMGHWIIAGLFAGAGGLLLWIWRNPAVIDWWIPLLIIAGALSLFFGYTFRDQEKPED